MENKEKRLNVSISAELHTKLKVKAASQNKTLAQWVIEAIQGKLDKEDKQE